MPIVEFVVERPYLRRVVSARDLNDPLRFMTGENSLLREVLQWLDYLRDTSWNGDRAALGESLLDYLHRDFSQHCEDEQLVCQLIAEATDGIPDAARLQAVLDRSHIAFAGLIRRLTHGLAAPSLALAAPRAEALAGVVRSFRALCELHIDWEEKLLLPTAGERLGRTGLLRFARFAAQRRGLAGPPVLRLVRGDHAHPI